MLSQLEPGFPKQMHHPQHAASVMTTDREGNVFGTPMRYPPEEALTSDDEARLRSRGYLPLGEAVPVMTNYIEYPLMLQHPDHVEAVPSKIEAVNENGMLKTFTIPGTPEKFPPQVVNNKQEEDEWEAKGWRRPGKMDAKAFDRATEAPGMPGAEWPKWVDGVLMQDPDTPAPPTNQYPKWVTPPNGKPIIVNTREEEEGLLGPLPEKVEPVPAPSPEEWAEFQAFRAWKAEKATQPLDVLQPTERNTISVEPDRAWLLAQAQALGIPADKRWGVRKLQRAIEDKQAA